MFWFVFFFIFLQRSALSSKLSALNQGNAVLKQRSALPVQGARKVVTPANIPIGCQVQSTPLLVRESGSKVFWLHNQIPTVHARSSLHLLTGGRGGQSFTEAPSMAVGKGTC